jgi:hypothetical protein
MAALACLWSGWSGWCGVDIGRRTGGWAWSRWATDGDGSASPSLLQAASPTLPPGSIAVLAGAVAIPAATLSHLVFNHPATAAVAAAGLVDLILTIRPNLPDALLAGLVPASMWTGQLLGLASSGVLRWPPQLWAGVVVLTALLAATLTWLLASAEPAVVMSDHGQPSRRRGRKLSSAKSPQQRVTPA